MSAQRERLLPIVGLTSAIRAARSAEMAALCRQEAELRRKLADLGADRLRRAAEFDRGPDVAARLGVDLRWLVWIEGREAHLTAELARLLARKEDLRADLSKAFGRDEVATRLLEKLAAEYRARRFSGEDL